MNMNSPQMRVLLTLILMSFNAVFTVQAQSKPKDSKIINYTTYALVSNYASNQNKNISKCLKGSGTFASLCYMYDRTYRGDWKKRPVDESDNFS